LVTLLCIASQGQVPDLDLDPAADPDPDLDPDLDLGTTQLVKPGPPRNFVLRQPQPHGVQSEHLSQRDQSQPLRRNIHHHATNHNPSEGISITTRPITTPQKEYPSPRDQSQPLRRNIHHHATNYNPSEGIFITTRPITTPQKEYPSPRDQLQPLRRNIHHHVTNQRKSKVVQNAPGPQGSSKASQE
jgi:hypothetical protein